MKIVAVLLLAIAVGAGCVDSRVSRPDPRFENFYDRNLGDNIFSDALSGFTPTAVLGFTIDKITEKNESPSK